MKNLPYIIILIIIIFILAAFYPIKENYDTSRSLYAKGLQDETDTGDSENTMSYDSGNYNVQYHDSLEDIQAQSGTEIKYFNEPETSFLADDRLFMKADTISDNENYSKYRFKTSNFVPTYEDSVFLSRLSDISHARPVYDSPQMKAGFCKFSKVDPPMIESKCRNIDKNICASVDCCILLGGKKCVAGDKKGPLMRANYNDPSLTEKDHYYHKGKCYGNCPRSSIDNFLN